MMDEFVVETASTPINEALIRLVQNNTDVPWGTQTLINWANLPTSTIITCADDNSLIGAILWQCVGEYAEIANIVTDQSYRRQGIGTVLLQSSIAYLRSKEVRHLSLEVRVSNHAAIGLYEKMGFKQVACRANYYQGQKKGTFEDAFVFVLDI